MAEVGIFLIKRTEHVAKAACKDALGSFQLGVTLLVYDVLFDQLHLFRKVYGEEDKDEAKNEDRDANGR